MANDATPQADSGTPLDDILARAHALLSELYLPAGILIFWSSRITYLGNRRPADLVTERDIEALGFLCDRLDAFADGVFL